MSVLDWAENEVKIACKKEAANRKNGEWDYGCACYESALKAFRSLMEDGHSGFSFSITRDILVRLMNNCPLTPIEGTDDEWNVVGNSEYQSKRRQKHLFFQYRKLRNEWECGNEILKSIDIQRFSTLPLLFQLKI